MSSAHSHRLSALALILALTFGCRSASSSPTGSPNSAPAPVASVGSRSAATAQPTLPPSSAPAASTTNDAGKSNSMGGNWRGHAGDQPLWLDLEFEGFAGGRVTGKVCAQPNQACAPIAQGYFYNATVVLEYDAPGRDGRQQRLKLDLFQKDDEMTGKLHGLRVDGTIDVLVRRDPASTSTRP